MTPGPILLRFMRNNKNEPFMAQVKLLDSNPTYANIRYPDKPTVSFHNLAPCPKVQTTSMSPTAKQALIIPMTYDDMSYHDEGGDKMMSLYDHSS